MLWHANDHRHPSSVKWLWIAPRGQQEDRATRLLDQSRASVAGSAGVLSGSRAGGYHGLGQSLATCFSPRPAWIITFHSVIFHHGSLQTDNWASRGAPRLGVPTDALRKRKRGREREGGGEYEQNRENPCTLHWKGWRRMDKNTLSMDLKRRLMAAMKKEMCF